MQCLGSAWIKFLSMRLLFGKKLRCTPITESFSAGETIEIACIRSEGLLCRSRGTLIEVTQISSLSPTYVPKNFTLQNFSQDRSKLSFKSSFAEDLAKLLLSSSTMYLKRLQETSDCRVCRVLAWSSNVIAKSNWPHFVSLFPVCKMKDTQNVQVTNEPQYGSLFR